MNTQVLPNPKPSYFRLFIMGLSSVLLCLSNILAFFAPVPLIIGSFIYGRGKAYMMGFLGMAGIMVLATNLFKNPVSLVVYPMVLVIAIILIESLHRNWSAQKTWFFTGAILVATILLTAYGYVRTQNLSMEQYVVQALKDHQSEIEELKKWWKTEESNEAIKALQLLNEPEVLAKEAVKQFMIMTFAGIFLMLWFNLFLGLKARRLLWNGREDVKEDERHLLSIRLPFVLTYALIAVLVFATWGEKFGPGFQEIGTIGLWWLGTLYFIQGFGVISGFLSKIGITGLWRTLFVMGIVLFGYMIPPLVGVLDNWFDFRLKMNKTNKI